MCGGRREVGKRSRLWWDQPDLIIVSGLGGQSLSSLKISSKHGYNRSLASLSEPLLSILKDVLELLSGGLFKTSSAEF